MHCRLLTQYAIIMVQFLAGLQKIKLLAAQYKGTLTYSSHSGTALCEIYSYLVSRNLDV